LRLVATNAALSRMHRTIVELRVQDGVPKQQSKALQRRAMRTPEAAAPATVRSNEVSFCPMPADPDGSLVAAARCGDAASVETLFLRRKGTVLRLAQNITRNQADAEDVMQDSFSLAFRRLDSFHGEARFSSWLGRITVNQSLVAIRKRRSREIPLDVPSESSDGHRPFDPGDPGLSPEECLVQQEMKDIVAAAVGQLKPSFRSVIEVHYLQENSTEETARILKLSGDAVKSRLHRARRKLRETLRGHLQTRICAAAFAG
jgi:RNA polymerase sigma-70 factor, ECF subfamily